MEKAKDRKGLCDHWHSGGAASCLHPLFYALGSLNSNQEVKDKVSFLFTIMDRSHSGRVSCDDMHYTLRMIDFKPEIYLTEEDFDSLTEGGKYCDEHGCLTRKAFIALITKELRFFMHRELMDQFESIDGSNEASPLSTVLFAVKRLTDEIAHVDGKLDSVMRSLGVKESAGKETEVFGHSDPVISTNGFYQPNPSMTSMVQQQQPVLGSVIYGNNVSASVVLPNSELSSNGALLSPRETLVSRYTYRHDLNPLLYSQPQNSSAQIVDQAETLAGSPFHSPRTGHG